MNNKKIILSFNNLIHETQKERGLAALYFNKDKPSILERLREQFLVVDDALEKTHLSQTDTSNIRNQTLFDGLKQLKLKRNLITKKKIELPEIIVFYSNILVTRLIELVEELAVFNKESDPVKISALINFLKWKERIGLERAIGISLLKEENHKTELNLKKMLSSAVFEQQSYKRMFLSLVDHKIRNSVDLISKTNKAFEQIEGINRLILKSAANHEKIKCFDPEEWFEIFTIKMDLLHNFSETLVDNLWQNNPTEKLHEPKKIYLEKPVERNIEKIKNTSLFSEIDDLSLHEILKHAQIHKYKKREKVFTQGDPASRFYLLLEGFVKVVKHNPDGQESVIQIVGIKEEILEISALNDNSKFIVTAEAVGNSILLSLPSSVIRDHLKKSKDLALNMLIAVSNRSQSIINQFSQVVTKDFKERVGYFLLNLLLSKMGRSKRFGLPYNKALIANYLNMRPETLSRALNELKETGVTTGKNIVTIADFYDLCKFCDSNTYSTCIQAGSNQCSSENKI